MANWRLPEDAHNLLSDLPLALEAERVGYGPDVDAGLRDARHALIRCGTPERWRRRQLDLVGPIVAERKANVTTSGTPNTIATLESFQAELSRLAIKFEEEFAAVTDPSYSEARLRQDYLDPFFRALGWDLENRQGLVQQQREVEIESRTDIAGRAKRADYLFRTNGLDKLICEAKKPGDALGARAAFQAKRYAWNKNLAPMPIS